MRTGLKWNLGYVFGLVLTSVLPSNGHATNAPKTLRVVSYNIAQGHALGFERSLHSKFLKRQASIATAFRRKAGLKNFDILGLQEICKGAAEEQLEYFRNILRSRGYSSYSRFAQANPFANDHCRSGQMILSRYPIVDSGVIELPLLRPGGKVALWADIEVSVEGGYQKLRVYNLHLDNRGKSLFAEKGRWRQMEAVLLHFFEWQMKNPNTPGIILGDFNSLNEIYNPWNREKTIRETAKYLDPSLRKYRATHLSGHQLDWIFSLNLKLLRSRVVYKLLSDHFPVSADYEFSNK